MSRNHRDLTESPHHRHNYANEESDWMRSGNRSYPRIAIIGAGTAGLRCADLLIKSGFKVTIFEGRNRIGGRINQASSGGHLMDLGPNWIHGDSPSNPIHRIAARTNTITHRWDMKEAVIDSTGRRVEEGKAARLSGIVWETIANAFKYSDDHSDEIDPSRSLWDYFQEEIPKMLEDPDEISMVLKMAQRWGRFIGDPIERQSLKFFFLEETIDGDNSFVAGTYQDILQDMGSTAMAKAEIYFNTEVVRLSSRTDPSQKRHTTTVRTTAGEERVFDEVVVTAPLGWLKKHQRTAFDPPLPGRVSQAIENMWVLTSPTSQQLSNC